MLLLPGREDEAIWRYFASLGFPPEEHVRRTLAALQEAGGPLSTAALEARVDLRRTRLEIMLKVLDVDGAVRKVRGGWLATGESWAYDGARYAKVARAREAEQQAMREYVSSGRCRMEFLRRQLDDELAAPCGRCDICAGQRHSLAVSAEALDAARAALGRPGVSFEPRRLWPTGMDALGLPLKGKIPAGEQAQTGRALGRLSDIGWGGRLRSMLAEGAPDAPVPAEVLDALVTVLSDWARGPGGWAGSSPETARPVGVVSMASASRPELVGSLSARIAQIGRLPLLGRLEYVGGQPPYGARSNSAQRLHSLAGSLIVPPALGEALAAAPGPVLLVDDSVDSGWTVTVAARLLRRAGAEAVLPLVLAVQA